MAFDPELTVTTSSPQDDGQGIGAGLITRMVIYALLCLVTTLLNAVVILTYWCVESVRMDVGNVFIVNVAYADLLVGVFHIPSMAYRDFYGDQWTLGETSCKLLLTVGYLDTFIPVVFIILLMAYRRLMISRSAKIRVLIRRSHVHIGTLIIWMVFFFFYLCLLFGYPAAVTKTHFVDYSIECYPEYVTNLAMSIVMVVIEFIVPLCLIFYLGIALLVGIRSMSARTEDAQSSSRNPNMRNDHSTNEANELSIGDARRNQPVLQSVAWGKTRETINLGGHKPSQETGRSKSEQPRQASTIQQRVEHMAPSTSGANEESKTSPTYSGLRVEDVTSSVLLDVECSRQRAHPGTSGATLQRAQGKEDNRAYHDPNQPRIDPGGGDVIHRPNVRRNQGPRRAAIRVLILVSVYLTCWFPYFLLLIINSACGNCLTERPIVAVIIELMIVCNSAINPFIYAGTNIRFRKGFVKILRLSQRWRR